MTDPCKNVLHCCWDVRPQISCCSQTCRPPGSVGYMLKDARTGTQLDCTVAICLHVCDIVRVSELGLLVHRRTNHATPDDQTLNNVLPLFLHLSANPNLPRHPRPFVSAIVVGGHFRSPSLKLQNNFLCGSLQIPMRWRMCLCDSYK